MIYRFLLVLLIILLTSCFIYLTATVIYPFLIALGIAFLINPIVNFFQHRARLPRALAVFLTLLMIISLFTGLIILLIAEIIAGANYLGNNVPKHLNVLIQYSERYLENTVIPFYEKISFFFNTLDNTQQTTIIENIQSIGATIGATVGNFIQTFFQKIPIMISWFPNAATVLIFSILATFFISKDLPRLHNYIKKLAPQKIKDSSGSVFTELKKALFGFVKAQFTLISYTTLLVLIGLLILRVDYAITIALITGAIDILPYIGSGIIFVPWIIYAIITGETSLAIGLSILYIIVIIQRQIMEPKVLSSSIDLDPLATLVALFIGYQSFGFLGLIIGPAFLVMINALHKSHVFTDLWHYIKHGKS